MIDLRKIIQETPRAKFDQAEDIIAKAEADLAKQIKANPDKDSWCTFHTNSSMSKEAMGQLYTFITANFVNKTQMVISWVDEYNGRVSYDYEPPKIKFSITR